MIWGRGTDCPRPLGHLKWKKDKIGTEKGIGETKRGKEERKYKKGKENWR